MFKRNSVLKLFLAMILLTAVITAGCGKEDEMRQVSPDPFTATWNLGEEERSISISGDTAGHEAGETSEFVLTFDNTRRSDIWSDSYCLVLLDRDGIVMELSRNEFTVSSGMAPQITVPVEFDASLEGAYGLSLIIPNRLQQVTTVWVGSDRQGDAGPWPQILTCPETSFRD